MKISAATWGRILVAGVVVAVLVLLVPRVSAEDVRRFIERAGQLGLRGAAAVILAYAVWCLLGLPASIMTLGAAVVFGFWRGLLIVYVGANLGAILGFLAARYIARDWIARRISSKPIFAQVDRAIRESGWRIVMLMRLPPISPFSVLNYAFALTSVRLGGYVLGTAIGMLPGTIAYVYLGTLLSEGLIEQGPANAARQKILIAGFVVTVFVCTYLVRLAKSALSKHAIGKES